MQTKTGEWWDYSWNVAPGCTKVSQECDHCWALSMAKRLQGMGKPGYEGLVDGKGNWSGKVNLINSKLEAPLELKKPHVIAVNLMGDLFHADVPDTFIARVFNTMFLADWHDFMVLTKRPERVVEVLQGWTKGGCSQPLPNIWIGTTAGTQRSANERWAPMSLLAQVGWNTWVSSEPRLEAIDWHGWNFLKRMITGGESGPYARPMSPLWARADRDWCQRHGVAFWFKQWGEWAPMISGMKVSDLPQDYPVTTLGGEKLIRFGRKVAGRMLDGRTWEEEIWAKIL